MKLLFFVHSMAGGGAERVCNTLANQFALRGDDVSVSFNMSEPMAYSFNESVHLFNLWERCRTTKFWSNFKIYRFLRTLYNMRRITKEVCPDFVIGVMTDYSLFSLLALAGMRVPIIATEHTNVDRMPLQYKRFYRFLYPFADAITVLTHRDYNIWKKRFKSVVCMPNPLTVENGQKTYKRKKQIIGVGRIGSPEKGFDSMVKCWNLIYKKHPEWKLVLVGKCEESDIKNLCGYLDDGKDSQIEFLGFRTDVYDIMLQSEVFALSSRYEGLPMGLMEAMSAGCCCVAFDVITGPSDIIRNNKSGILVENQNIEALADALDRVMSNNDLRHSLALNAPESVKKFEIDRILKRWDILFNKIKK